MPTPAVRRLVGIAAARNLAAALEPKLASVSNETRYKGNRTSSNGNEPIAAAETGHIRVDQNSACSVSATDDDDDGTNVDDDDDDWTTKRSKKKKKERN